jgi:Oxysterol-binding protein/PH domain
MEGYLMIWTNYIYGWKKKYFYMKGSILAYSNDKNKPQEGYVNLEQSQVSTHKNPKRFMIISNDSTMHLKALSVIESKLWIEKLNTTKSDSSRNNSFIDEVQNVEEITDSKAVFSSISKLWTLQEQIDLLYAQFSKDNKETFQLFLASTNEFKKLALDTLNMLEDQQTKVKNLIKELTIKQSQGIEPIIRSARDTMDQICMNRLSELSRSSENSIFIDAKSTFSEDTFQDVKSHLSYVQNWFYRKSLPIQRNPNLKINVWKSIKDYVKKDLSYIPVPLSLYEPLSILQRLSEDMTYNEILIRAADEPDPFLRHALVACFTISCYASIANRNTKPFTPLVGETFDLEKDGFGFIAEQVSFQPPISAWHCSHEKFFYSGWTKIASKFKGTYFKITPKGLCELHLLKFNEKYTWKKLAINVHNIIVGNLYLDHFGTYDCINTTTECKAVINVKKRTWFGQKKHYVEGAVYDNLGKPRYKIFGKWSEKIMIKNEINGEEIIGYKVLPYLAGYEENYFFSEFAMQLNIPPEFAPGISPTDSRYRPDIRALENGDIELAINLKNSLDTTQEKLNEPYSKWFRISGNNWEYKGDYWEHKQSGKFKDLNNIFNI